MNPMWYTLGRTALFSGLNKEDIKNCFEGIQYTLNIAAEKKILFSPQERADYFGLVLSGAVDIQKVSESGKVVLVARLYPGDTFGEAAVFAGHPYYPVSVLVYKASEQLLLHRDQLLQLLTRDVRLLNNFLRISAHKLHHMNQRLELLSLPSIRQKVFFYLNMELAQARMRNEIMLPFSKLAWAEYMNVSRPSLSRELKAMCNEGLLEVSNRRIRIIAPQNLPDLSSRQSS